jgi:hypothetical protein
MATPAGSGPSGDRVFFVAVGSAALTMLGAFLIYVLLEKLPGIVQLSALVPLALCLGVGLGRLAGGQTFKAAGVGAFVGMLVLWTPVVFATYGFGLLYLPLLALYALIVSWGAKIGGKSTSIL